MERPSGAVAGCEPPPVPMGPDPRIVPAPYCTRRLDPTLARSGLVLTSADHRVTGKPPDLRQTVEALWRKGASLQAIGRQVCLGDAAVTDLMRRLGLRPERARRSEPRPQTRGPRLDRRQHSPELRAKVEKLWLAGLAASQIGARVNLTKNATIALAHRMGLPPRCSPIKRRGAAPPPKPVVAKPAKPTPRPPLVPNFRLLRTRPKPVPAPRPATVVGGERPYTPEHTGCRWLTNDGAPRWMVCDAPRDGATYCAGHQAMSVVGSVRLAA